MSPERPRPEDRIDWRLCTWQGARKAQLQAFQKLSLREKLFALEELCDVSSRLISVRQQRGEPTHPLHSDDPSSEGEAS